MDGFPASSYTERGGVGTVSRADEVAALLASATAPEAEAEAHPDLAKAA